MEQSPLPKMPHSVTKVEAAQPQGGAEGMRDSMAFFLQVNATRCLLFKQLQQIPQQAAHIMEWLELKPLWNCPHCISGLLHDWT